MNDEISPKQLAQALDQGLPDYYWPIAHLVPAFKSYVEDKTPPGDFLRACLENDLCLAASRADWVNIKLFREIMWYMANELPSGCWGTHAKVEYWLGA